MPGAGARTWSAGLQRAQADLAVALTNRDAVGVERSREDLAQVRQSLGQLPQHPPVIGWRAGSWAAVLGVAGLFVPVLGVVAVVVALVAIVRGRARAASAPGARVSARLWIGLVLGAVDVALLLVALSR